MGHRGPLRIRLLGELQLVRDDGRALVLPASRKTRALLGYLIATGQSHRRERLCDLFWDGPDDPRAELRWSLSKIRPLLEDGGGISLRADRERVGIALDKATVDLLQLRSLLAGGVAGASAGALKEATTLFRGELLDGLDLPACYRYQEWCLAEREAVSGQRLAVLSALVDRLQDDPAEALVYARELVVGDPLSEAAHAAVVRLLGGLGRNREALAHYERARRVLEREIGAPPTDELEEARQALQRTVPAPPSIEPSARTSEAAPEPARAPSPASFSVGRDAERALARRLATAEPGERGADVVLVVGEPGIGKSHMLAYIGECMAGAGGSTFGARAYEAEAARPYGLWIDLLRAMIVGRSQEGLPAGLGLLLPELGASGDDAGDRARLFDAVVELLGQRASERPVAVTLDDIQWMDAASSSLLHYVVRHGGPPSGLLIACAARVGEIDDNAPASSVLRSLRREGRLQEIGLTALSSGETAELVRLIDPELDAGRIFQESDGNPLFTLELARAHDRGDAGPGATVETVIAGQLAPLADSARELLVWAAAHGRTFTPDDLARLAGLDTADLFGTLGELERRGIVRPVGGDAYDFTHDLVRQTAYRTLSQPRRRFLHRHIARALEPAVAHDHALAGDLVRHAALAEDDELAARACLLAGERALRLFANAEAARFAERGLHHVERLPDGSSRPEARIALFKVLVLAAAGPGMRPLPPLAEAIAEATRAAESVGLQAAVATGHYLLSVLHQEAGDTRKAEQSTLRAAEAGRTADGTPRARQLANTARCLLELETEVGRTRDLIQEAAAIVDPLGLELCELHWARGLLHRWDGEEELASSSIARALALARQDEDRWREYKCLTWLAISEQELGRYAEMQAHCRELKAVAGRLGEDETPFVETLRALALLAMEGASADGSLADALHRLRAVDDKSYLAYALNRAARLHLQTGATEPARMCATEALTVASIMQRPNEVALARAILARLGDEASAQEVEGLRRATSHRDHLGARARAALMEAASLMCTIPTAVSTVARQD